MDSALKAAHGSSYFWLVGFCMALAFMVSSCGLLPKKQYVLEKEVVTEDGTVYPAGTYVWADAQGEPTFENTGTPYLEDDVEKVEKLAESAEKTASAIPFGIGGIAGLVVGIAGTAAVGGMRKKREADRDEARDKLKKTKKS